jgi:hypothetical protein
MNNTLHTPAPWQVSPYGNITSKSGKIASVEQMPGNYESEKLANAHLISAAPDLLSALQAFVDNVEQIIGLSDFGNPSESDFPLNEAREALRKAKGEA